MKPSILGMTVQEERAALSQIRKIGESIHPHFILENGMRAGDFALAYIQGHHKKRQDKHKKKLYADACTGKTDLK